MSRVKRCSHARRASGGRPRLWLTTTSSVRYATIGHVDARLGTKSRQFAGEATVGHGLVGVGLTESGVAVPRPVELTVAAVQQIELRVSKSWVDVTMQVAVFVAQEPQPNTTTASRSIFAGH